jgi:predicted cupin superfamily sugar epimerase
VSSRSDALIDQLRLEPHPEGGFYRRIFTSDAQVHPTDGRPGRAALSAIYYLLTADGVSRWHRVASDEGWHHCEGAPLELYECDDEFSAVRVTRLGPLSDDTAPFHVVPAGAWQAARSVGEYTLVACTVAPGFDFADFALLSDRPEAAALLRLRQPACAALL